jgi:signal transduction histidine kinase
VETGDFRFYSALAHAAAWNSASSEEKPKHFAALNDHHRQLEVWALHCPANFATRTALVNAEIARIEGRILDAEHFYQAAIRSAHDNGFAHCEAVAGERAAGFYLARGFVTIAQVYLRDARNCYFRWGADAKVRQLEERYPEIRAEKAPADTGTIFASVAQLDLATVIRVSEAVSSEIEHEKLIDTLMRTAIECAGAERGILILPLASQYRIEAEATTGVNGLIVALRQADITRTDLPASVFQFVLRTRESLLLHDAAGHSSFSTDEYIRQRGTRSMLCLPIVKQKKLGGVLYLENNLAPFVFTSDRVAVLQLLASQAAISLENAALYADLQRSEAFLAQGQQISQTGSFSWSAATGGLHWSDGSYSILEYDRTVKASYTLAFDRVHPDDREFVRRALNDASRAKKDFDLEHRLLMPDGRVKHVHVIARAVNAGNLDFVGAVRDITERVRTEEALRQAQGDLERINRLTTMGELAASLAHEVSQPISGAMINANVCLRSLGRDEPDLEEARAAVTRIVRDAQRAAEIINRMRSRFEKGALNRELIDANESIREAVALLRGEAARYKISIRTALADDLPNIFGDRVQLQQVAMNLIVNSIEAMRDVEGIREMFIKSQRAENEQILLSVSDTGSGFPPQLAERLFDPFFTTKPHGTGMGLRISRSIIESHGGRLWADAAPGRGATFHVNLPAAIPGER